MYKLDTYKPIYVIAHLSKERLQNEYISSQSYYTRQNNYTYYFIYLEVI